jgi:hypothetical protein
VTIASAARDHEIQQLNERGWSQRRPAFSTPSDLLFFVELPGIEPVVLAR